MKATFTRVFKHSVIYSIGNLSSKLVGFILLPLYTGYLTVKEYGILSILEITSTIFIAIFGFGLYMALNRWYWDKDCVGKQKSIFFTVFISLSVSSLIIFGGFSFFARDLARLLLNSADYAYLMRLMIINTALQIIARSVLTLMRLQERSILFSLINIGKLLINLSATILLIVKFNHKVEGIYEAHIIGYIFFFILLIPYLFRNMTPIFERTLLSEMFSYSIPLVFTSLSGVILSISDRYCLMFLSGMESVGIYSLGYKIGNAVNIFVGQSAIYAITPIMYKMLNDKNRYRVYSKILTYFSFGMMLFILPVAIFARELIEILSQNMNYREAHHIVPIITIGLFFGISKNIAAFGINVMKKTKTTALVIGTVSLVNIVLNILLIPLLQEKGAALATLTAQLITFCLILYFAQKFYFIPYEYKKIIKAVLIGIVLITLASSINTFDLGWRILLKFCIIISYPILLGFFAFYESVEMEYIRNIPYVLKKYIQRIL